MVLPFAAKQKGSRARHKRRSWHGLGVLIAVLKRVVGRWWFYSKENLGEAWTVDYVSRESEGSQSREADSHVQKSWCFLCLEMVIRNAGRREQNQGSKSIGGPRWAFVVRRTRDSGSCGLEPRLLPSWQFVLTCLLDRRLL
jgi:hypothetical protein